ncbi:MAG: hypothetical protein J6S04_04955 [Clostridia bacterium]|nr:hypothetical protein [Clostridia bacterium]
MISLHSIMATGIASQLPTFIGIAAGVLLAVAFIVGFVKGFRKVSWDGLIWATAAGLFSFVGFLIEPTGGPARRFGITLAFAVGYIIAALVVYGLLAHFVRPKVRWVKDNVSGDTSLAEYGLEFEPEYLDYDGEHDPRPYGKRLYKTGFNPPKLMGRLLGGLSCAVMVGMVIWAVVSIFLLGINATSLSKMKIGAVLQNETVGKLLEFAQKVLLDWLCIGLIFLVAKKGFKKGLLNSLRGIIVSLGSVALVGLCFYLPFSKYATHETGLFYFLHNFSDRCANAMSSLPLADILGKVLAGACLSIGAGVIMFLINILLKKCCKLVSASAPTRMVDQILSCVFYMVIAVAICIGIWFVLAIMENFGLFNISEVLHEEAHLSNGLFSLAKGLVKKVIH